MKKFIIFFCLFVAQLSASDHFLAVCAIFQDEAPYLREWIEYHRMLGATKFYLYNNNSTDNYKEILKPYIKKHIVTLIDWPSPSTQDWTPYQVKAYNHCIQNVKNKVNWLAIIDIDEFIVPTAYSSITEMLRHYEGIGGLQIFWQFYGTSHIYEIPSNQTLIESLVMKAPKDHGGNYNFKSIVRPDRVSQFYVHGGEYIHPYFELFPHGTRGGAHQPINIDIARINHYWTRDEKYFREKKVARRERYEGSPYTEERIQAIISDLDQEADGAILRYVPALRARLGING